MSIHHHHHHDSGCGCVGCVVWPVLAAFCAFAVWYVLSAVPA